jgi:hypothetical protein
MPKAQGAPWLWHVAQAQQSPEPDGISKPDMPRAALPVNHKGRRKNNNNGSGVHMPQPPQKVVNFFLFLFFYLFPLIFLSCFWALRNKGSSKTRKRF